MSEFYGFRVGDTPLREVIQLTGEYGTRVYVKDESRNTASGTFKDRRNRWLLESDSATSEPIFYVGITSGNDGISRGRLCAAYRSITGKERMPVHIVHKKLPRRVKEELGKYGPVVELDLSGERYPNHTLADVARSRLPSLNGSLRAVETAGNDADGYGKIVDEILAELDPKYIFLPVGEGELMAKTIMHLKDSGSAAKVIGVTIPDNVFAGSAEFLNSICYNGPADKLACAYSDFRELLTALCAEGGHEIIVVPYDDVMREHRETRNLRIASESAAAAAFAGARRFARERGLTTNDSIAIINTGKGLFDYVGSRRRVNLAPMAAAALMLAMPPLLETDDVGGEVRRNAEAERWRIEEQIRLLNREEVASDIYAYAVVRGGVTGRPDMEVLTDLKGYYMGGYDPWLVRDLYNTNRRFHNNIDDFQEWLTERNKSSRSKSR